MTSPAQSDADTLSPVPAPEPTRRVPAPIRGMRAAFVFLTRIPVGGFPYRTQDWKWASAHAPFVGLVLGIALGGIDRLLLPMGPFPAATLVIGISLLATGAFHEDGLADTSDALGGAYDRARVFTILKDSRIGSFGGAALAISIVARAALLAELGPRAALCLPLAFCGARVGPIWLMSALPFVTPPDAAKSRQIVAGSWLQAVVAAVWFAAALGVSTSLGWITGPRALATAFALAVVTGLSGFRYHKRVGGVTGDFLGATEQLGEIAALAVLAYRV